LYVHAYICMYVSVHIHTNVHTHILQCNILIKFYKRVLLITFTLKKIYLQSKRSVFLGIFLRLL